MTQMIIIERIKKFVEKGNEILLKELNQLRQWEALLPVDGEYISHETEKKTLQYLMYF